MEEAESQSDHLHKFWIPIPINPPPCFGSDKELLVDLTKICLGQDYLTLKGKCSHLNEIFPLTLSFTVS